MKSIKEKAEERYPIITGELQTCNEKFVEGANYVLEQISQALQGDLDSHSAFKLKTIKQIVEELKSNQ
jgi:hypothetical protein